MFDIHSHVLPGLDDGPTRIQDSLEMLRSAQRVGVRAIVATPHCESHRGSLRASAIAGAVARLREAVAGDPEGERSKSRNVEARIYDALPLYHGGAPIVDPFGVCH